MSKGIVTAGGDFGLYNIKKEISIDRLQFEAQRIIAQLAVLDSRLSAMSSDDSEYAFIKIQIASYDTRYRNIKKIIDKITALNNKEYEVWCADLSEELSGCVSLIDVPLPDGTLSQNIRPGYFDKSPYDMERDGGLVSLINTNRLGAYYNWAILPGAQKWLPTYRFGKITAIDYDLNICSLTLDKARSKAQNLDINYQTNFEEVPIKYMECNAGAFDVDDNVLVEFQQQRWESPQVIGFKDNPQPCHFVFYLRPFFNGCPAVKGGEIIEVICEELGYSQTKIVYGSIWNENYSDPRRIGWALPPYYEYYDDFYHYGYDPDNEQPYPGLVGPFIISGYSKSYTIKVRVAPVISGREDITAYFSSADQKNNGLRYVHTHCYITNSEYEYEWYDLSTIRNLRALENANCDIRPDCRMRYIVGNNANAGSGGSLWDIREVMDLEMDEEIFPLVQSSTIDNVNIVINEQEYTYHANVYDIHFSGLKVLKSHSNSPYMHGRDFYFHVYRYPAYTTAYDNAWICWSSPYLADITQGFDYLSYETWIAYYRKLFMPFPTSETKKSMGQYQNPVGYPGIEHPVEYMPEWLGEDGLNYLIPPEYYAIICDDSSGSNPTYPSDWSVQWEKWEWDMGVHTLTGQGERTYGMIDTPCSMF